VWNEVRFGIGVKKTVEMRPGWFLRHHPSAFRFAYCAQQNDPDQIVELDGFINQCRPEMTLFDIGAHFGLFSLAALHYGGPGSRAVAVDPSPAACRIMRIQASLNHVAERLEIVQACAGDRVGWSEMVDSGVQSSGYFVPPASDHVSKERTRIPCITIDALAKRLGTQPSHVKIDVEGGERDVIRGGMEVLSRPDGPLLFIELHNEMVADRGGHPGQVLTLLGELGYDTFSPQGAPFTPASILERHLVRIMASKKQKAA
jgi:FkbM family methyltransferase